MLIIVKIFHKHGSLLKWSNLLLSTFRQKVRNLYRLHFEKMSRTPKLWHIIPLHPHIGPSTLVAQGPIKSASLVSVFICLFIYLVNWRFSSETTAPIFLIFCMIIDISKGKKVTGPDFWKRYFKGSKWGKTPFLVCSLHRIGSQLSIASTWLC